MVLHLSGATPDDVEQIADIHLAAFNSNILLHAQFPTSASLAALRSFLIQQLIASLNLGSKAILVVRDTEAEEKIISFAKWDLPIAAESQNVPFPDIMIVEGCNKEYLERYSALAEATRARVIGSNPCYSLSFVGTLPKFQGRGAGALLTKWGLEKAQRDLIPVYLESTISAAPLYKRLGFVAVDGLSMELPRKSLDSSPTIYEELGMLKTWDNDLEPNDHWDSSLRIASLLLDYEAGIKPQQVIEAIYERIAAYKVTQPSVWIHLQPLGEVLKAANELYIRWPAPEERPPLWGTPFSVKDSIDVAGVPTTIGCPALSYVPSTSAPVFKSCIDAGGLFIGSIRVPALFNGIVGLKPTKGTVSARGVAPACVHQDCVSFLASSIEDAETVWNICKGFDKQDVFSKLPSQIPIHESNRRLRFRFGVPHADALQACSETYRRLFSHVVKTISSNGGKLVDLDWKPFAAANKLLYNGSFVLERLTTLPDGWFELNKQLLHPVIRQVFENALARKSTAIDVFKDLHKQAAYKRAVEDILRLDRDVEDGVDEITVVVVPTTPFHPTIEDVAKDPIGINGQLGTFAHFANVLDLVAIAVPCGTYRTDERVEGRAVRLPFGVTILAGTGLDGELLKVVAGLEKVLGDIGQDDE